MVRQVEVAKPRRSQMAHSSVNAAPKKGGAGGSYTWGVADAEYDFFGVDANSFDVAEKIAPCSTAIQQHVPLVPFDGNLEDQEAFPCLPISAANTKQVEEVALAVQELPLSMDLADDWIVVSPVDTESLRPGALDVVDGQHPRNLFAKKPRAKKTADEGSGQERVFAIDWSQTGIPQEVKKHIIKASMDASHQGVYVKEQASALPLDVLRAQNAASKRRQNSAARSRQNSVPRSQSKPRVIKQPTGRR